MTLVHVDIADRVATLTLDDPERRNALTLPMVDDIVAAMDQIEADEGVGAIVVTGAPPAFCAGADLGNLGGTGDGPGFRSIYEGFLRVARSPLPTIAAVNGAAVGAGMNMALGCDLRIAAKRAKFDTRFVQIGLHPGGGHTWMLRRIVGPQVAAAAVLFGEVLDGPAAERVGLAYRCVDDADARRRPRTPSPRRAADGPRELVITVKETLAAMATIESHDEAVSRELTPQVWSTQQAMVPRTSRRAAGQDLVQALSRPRLRPLREQVVAPLRPTPRRSSRSARGLPIRR